TRWLYGLSKVFILLFPLVMVRFIAGEKPGARWPDRRSMVQGAVLGVLVGGSALLLYFGLLRGSSVFAGTPAALSAKMQEFGAATPVGFLGLAAFISLANSSLEEYY